MKNIKVNNVDWELHQVKYAEIYNMDASQK